MTIPGIGKTGSADEADMTIYCEDTPMRAVVISEGI
jgi:hypothetical protein